MKSVTPNEDAIEEPKGIVPVNRDHAEKGVSQELRNAPPRSYSLVSLAGIGLLVGTVWPAIGGSILVAIFNGGPPGVLYEFVAVSVCYWTVAASIAELASSMPSSSGVYLWATVTPGRRLGPVVGFFAGWWNYFAWTLGAASMCAILGNTTVQMYALNNSGFEPKPWHVLVVYLLATWISTAAVCLANSAMPFLNKIGIGAVLIGFLITAITMAAMPGTGGRPPHATSSFVWTEWRANIGYPNFFVFVNGMLNGAYSVGALDAVTHLAEEIPHPSRNIPIALGLQVAIGFVTGFCYLVVILYAISDFDALFASSYTIAEIYRQGTSSNTGAILLLLLIFLCIFLCVIGLYITSGRVLWTLARDGATPFSSVLGSIHPSLQMPLASTVTTAVLVSALGLLYLGSTTAFNAFLSGVILMFISSYMAAILPNLLRGRRATQHGFFHMPTRVGYFMNTFACGFMFLAFVVFCLPYSLPATAQNMNYSSVIWSGLSVCVATWWFVGARRGYRGPVVPDNWEL
ncbi:uncharacterized protein E0L32_002546 [Thyridium curvatum]|uniref:Amino acid transporter n=1 Tax=Thyridium curvatum TaxID=1093900 RepID=A0A507BMH1_9PEZI|nr:uncharacterized protein E0L32_002546 [Thyridium curvatum]TPX18689.1 hypothetical protein E0L32_002546 [Thyridium curvatum]